LHQNPAIFYYEIETRAPQANLESHRAKRPNQKVAGLKSSIKRFPENLISTQAQTPMKVQTMKDYDNFFLPSSDLKKGKEFY
jgi:hypothetical protein